VKRLGATAVSRVMNVGTPQLLMGSMWLYLWLFPWRPSYLAEPHWGHNYTQSLAFVCVGLAYFSRRLISDWLGLAASMLVIPASLELVSHTVTASAAAACAGLIIVDILVERGRKDDLGQSSNRRLTFWLKKHLLRFSFIMLAHIPLTYFMVRLPSGTYETDLVTKVFDGMFLLFVIIALREGAVQRLLGVEISHAGFFWGMLTIVIPLIILSAQPETRVFLVLSVVVTVAGVAALATNRRVVTG
jgi:hypothetical protein